MKTRLVLAALAVTMVGFSPVRMDQHRMVQTARRHGLVEQTVQLGEFSVHYWKGGSGPPLLLIHGFGGDGLGTWRLQLKDWMTEHTVIVPDLLWFGGSGGPGPYTLERQAEAALALLDHEHIDRADVVGISYGGFVVLQLATVAPQRLHRTVIVDSPGPEFSQQDYDAFLQRFHAATAEDIFVPTRPDQVRVLLDLSMVHPPRLPDFLLKDLYQQEFSANLAEHRAMIQDLLGRRSEEEGPLPTLPGPAMVVWGEEDPVFPLAVGQRLASRLGAKLVVIPNTKHAPLLEQPRMFGAAVKAFLGPESAE